MRRNVTISLARLGAVIALSSGLVISPTFAHAQDDVTLSMARERFKEGVAYFDKKDFAKARVAFLQAYALKKHPAVLLNLAQSELRSGHEADAAQHFSQYLREHKDATEAERQGAETGLTAAKALVAEVTLSVDATGAEVYVDGDLHGQAPLPGPIFLPSGNHELRARKGESSASSQVNVTAGQSSSVTLRLEAPVKKAPPERSSVALEGAPPEQTPESSSRGRKPFFSWLTSTPGAMVGVGLSGVGLIGGGAFALGSKSAYDAADSLASGIEDEAVNSDKKASGSGACVNPASWLADLPDYRGNPEKIAFQAAQYERNCAKYQDSVSAGDTYKTIAVVGLSIGAAAAVGTVIYYFVDSGEAEPSETAQQPARRVTLTPLFAPGFAGGLVSGRF
jgi:PEGA domain